MFELKSMTYEEGRKEYFEELKADAVRKMEYWSKRVDKDGPWNPRVRAYVYANEWGAVVNYLNDALKAFEVMPKDGDMRLIDADALMEKCIENLNDDEVFDSIPSDYVDDAPTIDAEPVRHGRWIPKHVDAIVTKFQCSECHRTVEVTNDYFGKPTKFASSTYPYCHCGTKMDLGVQDEQSGNQ